MGPLAGLRVLDLTSVVMGPYCTQFLGDYGADVIKVEPPAGDLVRQITPARHPGMGAIFLNSNRSKRSIVIDLKAPGARDLVLRLARGVDVMVYNVRPAAMARLGLGYEDVAAANPRLIYAGLYGFGQDGPYAARPAYDDLIQGGATMAHLFAISGSHEPRYVPTATADRIVGLVGLSAILAAVVARTTTGRGQRVDVPMFETMTGFVLADHLGGLSFDPPHGPAGYRRQLAADRKPLATRDGHVCALVYTDDHWRRFLTAIGEEARLADPRFATYAGRNANIEMVYGWLIETFRSRTTAEWLALLERIDVPALPMHTFDTVMDDPHLRAVDMFRHLDHPSEGPIVTLANPVRMSETPVRSDLPAPRLGEHSRAILAEAGLAADEIAALLAAGVVAAAATGE